MPLTPEGLKIFDAMVKKHGADKGKEIFYASINKGVPGANKWHRKGEKNKSQYSKGLMK